jgi:xanthine/uracil permease
VLAGSFDLTAAFVQAGLKGRSPVSVLQGIAGGLLGMSSFRGGPATAALGALFHFLIATTAAAVFYLASRKLKFLVRQAILSGLLYGVAVYIFMYYFVLPISAYHPKIALPPMTRLIRDVTVHMFMVGLPISLVVRKNSAEPVLLGRVHWRFNTKQPGPSLSSSMRNRGEANSEQGRRE